MLHLKNTCFMLRGRRSVRRKYRNVPNNGSRKTQRVWSGAASPKSASRTWSKVIWSVKPCSAFSRMMNAKPIANVAA